MALARVVTFEGITSERMAQMKQEIEGGEPPAGMPPVELMILHDPESDQGLAIVIVDNEDDYAKADAILDSMPAENTPGRRTAVSKFTVGVRMKS